MNYILIVVVLLAAGIGVYYYIKNKQMICHYMIGVLSNFVQKSPIFNIVIKHFNYK